VAIGLGLLLLPLVVFAPALHGSFLWDDALLLTRNPYIRSPQGLYHLWLTGDAIDYFPLAATTFWIEWRLWGENTLGYHVVSALLHGASAVLIWRLLRRLAVPGALTAATLFAVHPVTVASVAWIAERRNTLSLALAAAALLAWVRFDDGDGRRWYPIALGLFLLALFAKTAVVMLPVVLLGLAWYRRGRVTRTELVRTVPFFVLSLVLGLVTVHEQQVDAIGGATVRPEGVLSRVAAAGWVIWFYVATDLVPARLMMVYPRWTVDPGQPSAWVPLAALLLVLGVAWRRRATWGRPLLAGLGYFVVMLAPVLGLVTMYFHRYAFVSDHLQYVALPGLVALVVAACATATDRWTGSGVRVVLAVAVVAVLAAATWQRAHVFAESRALWAETVRRNPGAAVGHANLGLALFDDGEVAAAARHFDEAIRLDPTLAEAYVNRGRVVEAQGRLDDARADFEQAIRLVPALASPHNNLGEIWRKQGAYAAAEAEYTTALRLDPLLPEAHNNLGVLLAADRPGEAEVHYRAALAVAPAYVEAHSNLGNLLRRLGRLEEASRHHAEALRLRPGAPELHNNLATVLTTEGRHDEAIVHYRAALAARPDLAEAHHNLATSLLRAGRADEAVEHYAAAVRLKPTLAASRQGLEEARAARARRDARPRP
jgi:tetratricopeptide (TPR) repeat protein